MLWERFLRNKLKQKHVTSRHIYCCFLNGFFAYKQTTTKCYCPRATNKKCHAKNKKLVWLRITIHGNLRVRAPPMPRLPPRSKALFRDYNNMVFFNKALFHGNPSCPPKATPTRNMGLIAGLIKGNLGG